LPVSAIVRPAVSSSGGVVVVKGKADGVTDDSAAFAAAITATGAGGAVYVPAGTYIIQGLAVTQAGLTIYGPGVLKVKAATKAMGIRVTAANVTIGPGLTIDGQRSTQTGVTGATTDWDLIRVEDTSGVTVVGNTLLNSAGSGVAIYRCADCEVSDNQITNLRDNGIVVGGLGADRNRILRNVINQTSVQNGIFLTASPASTPTTNYIYDNTIADNTVLSYGDTGIESGIHTVRTVISGNRIKVTKNSGILIRDSLNCWVHDNDLLIDTGAANDAISIVPQTELASYDSGARVQRNHVQGPASPRSCIYVGQAGALIENNILERTTAIATDGSDLTGRGVCLGSVAATVRGNTIRGFYRGVDCNYAATAGLALTRLIVENNDISTVFYGVSLFSVSSTSSRITGNRVVGYYGRHILLTSAVGNTSTELSTNWGDPLALGGTVANLGTVTVGYPDSLRAETGNPVANLLTVGEETFPRTALTATTLTTNSGTLRLSYFTARKTETVTQVRILSGGTSAAATPTLVKFGLYSIADTGDGTLVASTASDTALLNAPTARFTKSFSSSYTKSAGQRYAVAVLVVTTVTAPSLSGVGSANSAEFAEDPRVSAVLTSQTDLPSSFTAGSLAASGSWFYAALLP
jgi:parallel beta-helix repeat protein